MIRLSARRASTDGRPPWLIFLGHCQARAGPAWGTRPDSKDWRGALMTPDDFPKNPKDFFSYAKKNQAEMVDLKFVDMLGSWQHCSFPVDILDEGTFEEGLGFDGSSIRGWMGIHESDMMAVPDPETRRLHPFFANPTGRVNATVVDPTPRKAFSRAPRHVARKAEEHLKQSGIADTCFIGPEPEFFIFDEVRYEQNQHRGYYQID